MAEHMPFQSIKKPQGNIPWIWTCIWVLVGVTFWPGLSLKLMGISASHFSCLYPNYMNRQVGSPNSLCLSWGVAQEDGGVLNWKPVQCLNLTPENRVWPLLSVLTGGNVWSRMELESMLVRLVPGRPLSGEWVSSCQVHILKAVSTFP